MQNSLAISISADSMVGTMSAPPIAKPTPVPASPVTATPGTLPAHAYSAAPAPVAAKYVRPEYRFEVRLQTGQRIKAGPYALENLEYLGSGGNGSVFRMLIVDGDLRGLIVATKFLENLGDGERAARFDKEISILRETNHPHVIKVIEAGRHTIAKRNVPFFVMEYQPRNLQRETAAHPRGLHPDTVLPLCLQMISAVTHIHAKGVAHRDLKPANILFDGSNVKLADFGIASLTDRSPVVTNNKGKKIGPHFFLSPEQWKYWKQETEVPAGKESDIFQLGLVFVKLLTGYNPNTVFDWENNGRLEPKVNVRTYDGSLVNDIAVLVKEMLEVDPAKRPTASAVQDRLLGTFRSYSSHFTGLYGVRPGREF